MKKFVSFVLVLTVLILSVSCGNEEPKDIPEMIKAAYSQLESEKWIKSLPAAQELSYSDERDVKYHLGLSLDAVAEKIESAYYSCSDIQPSTYELNMVKVKDGVDKDALVREMVSGVNLRKWICVGAAQAGGAYFGDYIVCIIGSNAEIDAVFAAFSALYPDMSEIVYKVER